jgi:hypothetical protein
MSYNMMEVNDNDNKVDEDCNMKEELFNMKDGYHDVRNELYCTI